MSSSMRCRKGVIGRMIFMRRLLACMGRSKAASRDSHAADAGVIVGQRAQGGPDELYEVERVWEEGVLPDSREGAERPTGSRSATRHTGAPGRKGGGYDTATAHGRAGGRGTHCFGICLRTIVCCGQSGRIGNHRDFAHGESPASCSMSSM